MAVAATDGDEDGGDGAGNEETADLVEADRAGGDDMGGGMDHFCDGFWLANIEIEDAPEYVGLAFAFDVDERCLAGDSDANTESAPMSMSMADCFDSPGDTLPPSLRRMEPVSNAYLASALRAETRYDLCASSSRSIADKDMRLDAN